MKQELIEQTKDVLQQLINEWDRAELRREITRRLAQYVVYDIADIIDILDNYEKYE